jgi:hypothetical protein
VSANPSEAVTRELEEERDFLLRSLQDLEAEHGAGDIDDLDYQALKEDYTTRAATVLRALAAPSDPADPVDEEESLAEVAAEPGDSGISDASRGDPGEAADMPVATSTRAAGLPRRRKPVLIAVSAVIVLGGIGWAVVASSSHREAGEEITGQGVGVSQETKLLLQAQQAADRGDPVTELRDARAILATDPTQPQALTMEGWLLAQTQQPKLLAQGIGLLALAEQVDPSFAEPHAYRGIAFLSEGDNRDAIPELKWYLAHKPDPKLAPKIRAALAKAQAAVARSKAAAEPGKAPTGT